jgi:hypothetical protein
VDGRRKPVEAAPTKTEQHQKSKSLQRGKTKLVNQRRWDDQDHHFHKYKIRVQLQAGRPPKTKVVLVEMAQEEASPMMDPHQNELEVQEKMPTTMPTTTMEMILPVLVVAVMTPAVLRRRTVEEPQTVQVSVNRT